MRVQLQRSPVQSRVVVALAHEDRVGVDTRADHKQRLGLAAHLPAFALADREKVGAVVLAHHLAHVGTKGKACARVAKSSPSRSKTS